jgi:hypothetical protein
MEPDKNLIKDFLEGGWIIMMIGGSAMLARLLASNTAITITEHFKKIISAAIASGIAWFILKDVQGWELYKAIAYGIVGVISPEIIDGIIKIGKKFAKNPEKMIKR